MRGGGESRPWFPTGYEIEDEYSETQDIDKK
jgi:hypothetical protein